MAHFSDRPRSGIASLTPRERRICDLVTEGLTNTEIGKVIYVAEQTVKFHLSNVYRKLALETGGLANSRVRRVTLAVFWLEQKERRSLIWDCCGSVIYTPHCPWCGGVERACEASGGGR